MNVLYSQYIERVSEELKKMRKTAEALRYEYEKDNEEKASRLTNDLVAKSEELTKMIRYGAAYTFAEKKECISKNAADSMGITVDKNGDVVEITLPFLLPKKKSHDSRYIGDVLHYVLSKTAVNNKYRIYEKAVVVFIYTYSHTGLIHLKDYDNIESKKVLDIISLFMLPDDNPEACSVLHKMEHGEKDITRVLIMPERCLCERVFAQEN